MFSSGVPIAGPLIPEVARGVGTVVGVASIVIVLAGVTTGTMMIGVGLETGTTGVFLIGVTFLAA